MEKEKNEVVVYEVKKAEIKPYRNNYEVNINGQNFQLKRDVDFGMMYRKDGTPLSQRPTLFKSGAHRILTAYGLFYVSEIVDKYADYQNGFFYYAFKTTAYYNGVAVRTGYGCSNTNEKSTGKASGFDTANTKMKLAEKRSEVDLAIKLADASSLFVQDIEDTNNLEEVKHLVKDDDCISAKQVKRMFAIGSENEVTVENIKKIVEKMGYSSSNEIKQKDYDAICEEIEHYHDKEKGVQE